MKVKSLWGVLILLTVALFSFNSKASVFTVTNPAELQDALDEAAQNGEDDVINILAGNYDIGTSLSYKPATDETYSLVIKGDTGNPSDVIFDGTGNIHRILDIDLSLLSEDNILIKIENITFQNSDNYDSNGTVIKITGKNANVILLNNIFQNNTGAHGYLRGSFGSIYISLVNGNISVNSNQFLNNSAKFGGALYIENGNGNVEISDNTFEGNKATILGGALFLAKGDGKAFIRRNIFKDNEAENFYGGAIYTISGTGQIFVFNNILANNSAGSIGGGLYSIVNDGQLWLVNNTISNNKASNYGAGIYTSLYTENATANIYNNIIRGNSTEAEVPTGEDIYIENDYMAEGDVLASPVNLFNNDLGENVDVENPNSEDLYVKETSHYQHGNNIFDDPMFVDIENENYHLKANSPCINTGNNDIFDVLADMEINIDTDIDGDNRIIGDIVDIGADELSPPNMLFVPELLQFGEFNVGDEPVTQTLTITNNDTRDVSFKSIYIWGIERKAYKIVGNNCIGNILNSGESCGIDVQLTPSSVGQKNAFIVVRTLDANNSKFIIKLRATVRSKLEPNIEAEPSIINFGNVKVETASIPETIQVTNTGDSDLIIHKVKIYGINANEYTVDSENCTQTPIAAGSSCEISVIFIPQSEGDKKGTLIIYSNDPDNFDSRILLRGTGIQN